MASETFKKRQKEAARREKKQKKAARLAERKNTKEKTGNELQEEKPKTEVSQLEPTRKPIYLVAQRRPEIPK
jgi:hypothetical protein